MLSRAILPTVKRPAVTFSRSEDTSRWDLMAVGADDNSSAEWGGLDLCEIFAVTLKYCHS
jgi:hypothetical protein